MPYAIVIMPGARRQIVEARDWWQVNRPAAPMLLRDELDRALERITESPNVGTLWPRRANVRKLVLGRVGFFVLYRVLPRAMRVEVLALWHGHRGTLPPRL